jgi:tellurite resistance protein TerC
MIKEMFFASESQVVLHSYDVPGFMYGLIVGVLLLYAFLEWKNSKDHVIGFREAVRWSVFYISLALLFGVLVFVFIGKQAGAEYLAAWAIEKSLSLDNLFVIGLIFTSLKVPSNIKKRILNYGIAGAIFFRLLFILAGFELLRRFEWVSIVFGLILLRTAWHTFQEAKEGADELEKEDITKRRLWKMMSKILPIHHKFEGHKLTTIVNGKRMLTMMAATIILVELTDIVFAVDSVPAVLAVSPDRFIAYSSNVFALLGLRALFFVYHSVEEKFWALTWSLGFVLTWIGFKMVAAPLGLHVPVAVSLGVLGLLLGGGIAVSLAFPKHHEN